MLKKTAIGLLAVLALTACNKKRAPVVGPQRLADTVYFDYNSSVIEDREQQVLNKQAAFLAAKKQNVTVEGHCDERGTREYNLALGERRAHAVKSHLEGCGVPACAVTTTSYGKERPVDNGHNEESWAKNRRAITVFGGGK